MQANTNKVIFVNTIALYCRLAIVSLCQILVTRYALQALGAEDFGLFSVIGSIIVFVGIINTIMVSTTNRYIAIEIGKGKDGNVNEIFNISLVLHILIAIITTVIAFPLGEIYIRNFINYDGDVETVLLVYRLVIVGSIASFVTVPYQGLLTAMERFVFICGVDIICNVLKLFAAFSMLYLIENKLIFYSLSQSFLTAMPLFFFCLYCKNKYADFIKWNFVRSKNNYKEMLSFSGWVGFGAVATVGKAQAAQLLVNAFFTTSMNAALGIANTISHFVVLFSNNITQPIAPQITKNYAAGNFERCTHLLILSTKFTFFTMLFISSPFFICTEWILSLWLGYVPDLASEFTILLIVDTLITSINAGISNVIFAYGKIAFYQFSVNSLRIFSVIGAYIVLKVGFPSESIFYVYILFSVIIVIFTQLSLFRIGKFKKKTLFVGSYLPSFAVLCLYLPFLIIPMNGNPILQFFFSLLYLTCIIYFVGLTKSERKYIFLQVSSRLNKH